MSNRNLPLWKIEGFSKKTGGAFIREVRAETLQDARKRLDARKLDIRSICLVETLPDGRTLEH